MTPTDAAFLKAITTIKTLSQGPNALGKPPAERKVQLYGLYKQATEGNVEGIMPRPHGSDPQSRANQQKWDAWKSREGMSKQEAKLQYVEYLLETMRGLAPGLGSPSFPGSGTSQSGPTSARSGNGSGESQAGASGGTAGLAQTGNLSQAWSELEEALRLARLAPQSAPATRPTPRPASGPPASAAAPPSRPHSRRLSAGSLTSSYSHFLRNPILASPGPRTSAAFSEFGLSEKDRSELQADQIVDRLQSAYPPVLPGAVAPLDLAVPYPYEAGGAPAAPADAPSLGEWLGLLYTAVRTWTASAVESVLRRLLIDTAKLLALLLVLRIAASRPDWLRRSPVLRLAVNTVGKVMVVVLDSFGIEMRWKKPVRPASRPSP